MTESEWLVSSDPSAMYSFVVDKVTKQQKRFFVEEVDRMFESPFSNWSSNHDILSEAFRYACQSVFLRVDLDRRCDALREIVGNPFRLMVRHSGLWWMDYPIGKWAYKEKPPNSIEFDPVWLTWSNATVPNLIRAMMEEECMLCEGSGIITEGEDWDCPSCDKRGFVPRAEPQWEMMPILGDALEEAGCAEAAILDHLRGAEPCPHCPEEPDYPLDHSVDCTCGHKDCPGVYLAKCEQCNGTGKRAVKHVRGCWVVELLTGGMQ